MVEAAKTYGRESIVIQVSKATLSSEQLDFLRAEVAKIGRITLDGDGDRSLIKVTSL